MNAWQRRWKRIKNVPGLATNLVAVAAAIVIGSLVLVFILANLKFVAPWDDRMTVTADFESADALEPGAKPKVRIAGVQIGQVTDVELTDDGRARVTMSLEDGQEIHEDATALLRPKSVLNEMYVEISPGTADEATLSDGDAIKKTNTVRPVQADEVFQDLDQRTRDAISDLLAVSDTALANAPETLPASLDEFNRAERTFTPVLQKLETRRASIAKLVTAVSLLAEATGDNRARTARLASSLRDVLTTLSGRQDELSASLAEVPGLGDDLRQAMGSIEGLAGELNPALENISEASRTLPPTLKRLDSTIRNVGRTSRAAAPVVRKARPLIGLLGPVVGDARTSLGELRPLAGRLDPTLDVLLPYLTDLKAFIYNTSGVFTAADATGGMIRGHVTVPLPFGAVVPGTNGGNPSPVESRSSR